MSAFAGRGKLGALKLMRSEHFQEMFRELGQLVLAVIRGRIQEAAIIHMQTIHIIHDNRGSGGRVG